MLNNIIPIITVYNSIIPKLIMKNQHAFFNKVILIFNKDFNEHEIEFSENIIVLKNSNNNFVAGALNKGIKYGIKKGYNSFLLLDDDSCFVDNDDILELQKKEFSNQIFQLRNSSDNLKSNITITNGTVIHKNIFKIVGDFNEEMGIDLVDVDYYFRVLKLGFNFPRTSKIYFYHDLGYYKGKLFTTPNYNSFRYYKQVKNLIILSKNFYKDFPKQILHIICRKIYYFLKIIIFENNRKNNLKNILKGLKSGL